LENNFVTSFRRSLMASTLGLARVPSRRADAAADYGVSLASLVDASAGGLVSAVLETQPSIVGMEDRSHHLALAGSAYVRAGERSDRLFRFALGLIVLVAAALVLVTLGVVPSGGLIPGQ
jgi:hypothetical protein